MDKVTAAKVTLALVGVGTFSYGIRSEDAVVRWVGIAFVVAAFLLRFFKKRVPDEE